MLKYYCAKMKNRDKAKCCWGCRKTGSLIHYRWAHKMEDSWAGFFLKNQHSAPIWPNNYIPGHLSHRNEDLSSHTKKGIQIFHYSFIHNSHKLGRAEMFFIQWVNHNTNCGTSTPWNTTQQNTGANHQHTKKPWMNLQRIMLTEKVCSIRLHTE